MLIACGTLTLLSVAAGMADASQLGYAGPNPESEGLHYEADPGESNRLTIDRVSGGKAIRLRDPGATIRPQQESALSCVFGLHEAHCPTFTDAPYGTVSLGDGNDQVDLLGSSEGETASLGRFDLYGAAGDDRIAGGPVTDDLDGGPGADTIFGGGGLDWVHYSSSPVGVSVSIDGLRNDGAPGELDLIADDVEGVFGSHHDDSLVGGPSDNDLYGLDGNDVLRGLAGDDWLSGNDAADQQYGGKGDDDLRGSTGPDVLVGGAGQDALFGDDGNDRIYARDAAHDFIRCGPGVDLVVADKPHWVFTEDWIENLGDDPDADCEKVRSY